MQRPQSILQSRTSLRRAEMDAPLDEARALANELQQVVKGEVRFDGWSRSLYSTDASLYQIQPIGVVLPRTVEDLHATLEVAARWGAPVLARGSGSSLAGQAVGACIVLDCSRSLDRILAIDAEARTVTVQPGVIHNVLNRTLAPLGLMVGPDPASSERATMGGSIANNASGSHSILYGMMADAILAADVLLADGAAAYFGPVDVAALPALQARPGLEGQIYRELAAIVPAHAAEMHARWPRHWRRASGYALDRLLAALAPEFGALPAAGRFAPRALPPQDGRLNLAPLLAGSEGTLALITAATLRLEERPRHTGVAVVHFDHLLEACAAVPDILEREPSACELLDRQLIGLARVQPEWARRMTFLEGDPAAVLLTEFTGESAGAVAAQVDALEAHLRVFGVRGAIVRVLDAPRQADLWAVRKAGLNLLMSRRGDVKPIPGIEDVSVPPEHLASYLEEVLNWCSEQGRDAIADVAVYAHASAGCLHVRPLVNVKKAAGVAIMAAMAEHAMSLCLRYGGAMSGEHGDGLARSGLNEQLFGPALYAALQQVKAAFDPHNLLNPGKVVNAPPLTDSLRMGADYATIPIALPQSGHLQENVFDWSADGGFAEAVEMCNGAGVCRKLESGVMCPSFMATRDERDSTRGRANALRNALAGRIPHEALFAPEMEGALDLCLGCKACKSECPSSVDMARIKSEYMVHYYRRNGLPLFNRLMGLLPTINASLYRLAPWTVPAVNALLQAPVFKQVQGWISVAPERTLPLYAPKPFSALAAEEPSDLTAAPTVILFHDTWTESNEPEVGLATLRLLRAAGYDVRLAHGRACCGRPLITGGQADRAKPWIDHNVALLAPLAVQGIAIVGIEPSCILTLRDEAPALASDKRRAALVAQACVTLEEFVVAEMAAGRFAAHWRERPGKALLHGHCHTRALVGNEASVSALKAAGYVVEVIPSGCCGMAGDFGYEADHYDISRTIAEDRLLPAVRAAATDTVIVASGTSCRHQIADLAGRQTLHLAQALERALLPSSRAKTLSP